MMLLLLVWQLKVVRSSSRVVASLEWADGRKGVVAPRIKEWQRSTRQSKVNSSKAQRNDLGKDFGVVKGWRYWGKLKIKDCEKRRRVVESVCRIEVTGDLGHREVEQAALLPLTAFVGHVTPV
jgi:hypothetical protein